MESALVLVVASSANTTIEASTGLSGAKWYVDSEKVAEGRSAEVVVGPGASMLEIKGLTPSTVYSKDVTMLSVIEPEVKPKKEVSRGIVTYETAAKLTATISSATLAAGAVAGYMAGKRRHRKKTLETVKELVEELNRNGFTHRARNIIKNLLKL